MDVLELTLAGKTQIQIANQLHISILSVKYRLIRRCRELGMLANGICEGHTASGKNCPARAIVNFNGTSCCLMHLKEIING